MQKNAERFNWKDDIFDDIYDIYDPVLCIRFWNDP